MKLGLIIDDKCSFLGITGNILGLVGTNWEYSQTRKHRILGLIWDYLGIAGNEQKKAAKGLNSSFVFASKIKEKKQGLRKAKNKIIETNHFFEKNLNKN